jgi:2',3'-cyclic-nucleotide 2'-phosphodiesterase (5'-nucleotidase family)
VGVGVEVGIPQLGGTPVAGVQFLIDNGKAAGVMIQNEPLDSNRPYRVAMPDYVANGGDGCKFLQAAERIEVSPQLLFDVVLQAFQEKYQANQLIKSNEDGRVRYK